MKRLVQILYGLLAGWLALAGVGWPVSADTSEQKLAWFRDAKFGLFLHWGPASLTGKELSWSRMGARPGDIVAPQEVPVEVYDNLYKDFNPVKFNAAEWVRIAQDAGMKYLVIITKHHDGFSMFHTKHSEYGIANTPFGRDIVKELADACHRAGLRFGVYYSQRDWYHPEYLKGNNANYTEFLHNQVRELLSNYGKVDIVWFDSFGRSDLVKDWKVYELLDMIHKLQPAALVNNRLAILGDYNKGPRDLWGDYDTPEERIGSFQHGRAWESCMTLVGRQWSYRPGGRMYTREETIRHLVNTATGDGNLLLNVGPTPAGEIEPRQVERLREVGQWLTRYGESIYSTRGGPFRNGKWGGSTYRGKTIYLHVIDWGASRLDLPPLKAKITKWASLTGGKASLVQTAGGIRILMPVEGRDPVDTILRLDLDGPAMSEIPAGVPLAVPASNP